MLKITALEAWYGQSYILQGVDLSVEEGQIVSLVGRNGAGKTTLLRSIMGLVTRRRGNISHRGGELVGLRPYQIARTGIGYCPEERGIFASLNVGENLMLPPTVSERGYSKDEIVEIFPPIRTRWRSPGGKLSGGEQQMLAIARILRTGARLLLLDEPTEGLAPVIVQQIGRMIGALKTRGYTILLIEQNLRFVSSLADRHYVLDQGRIVDSLDRASMSAGLQKLHQYLGV